MKPELTSLSMLTSACSFYLGSTHENDFRQLLSVSLGTLLVGGGAGALNEYLERNYDALMRRTERRPIPSGRIPPLAALFFGGLISLIGLAILFVLNNTLTAFFALLTLATYLLLYTPLKRVTWWNTLVGAVPGSLPTLIGWSAARNELSPGAWILFAMLFVWQIPHFLSLAWTYKKDYARAGFRMLPVFDESGKRTSFQILLATILLLIPSFLAPLVGLAGSFSFVCSILLSFGFLFYPILFRISTNRALEAAKANVYSRRIFFTSLVYLPVLMLAMVVDKM